MSVRARDSISLFSTVEIYNHLATNYLTAQQIEAQYIKTDSLTAKLVEADYITATEIAAEYATIANLSSTTARIGDLEAIAITTLNLNAKLIDANVITTDTLNAALINSNAIRTDTLDAAVANLGYITATAISSGYAEIDLANVELISGEAFITEDLVTGNAYINAAYIKNLAADSLKLRGKDGLYYAINVDQGEVSAEETDETIIDEYGSFISGEAMLDRTITASKIYVDDLYAIKGQFGTAMIGGLTLESGSIHTANTTSVTDNDTGFYLNSAGEMLLKGTNAALKFYNDSSDSNKRKLEITADNIFIGSTNVSDALKNTENYVGVNLFRQTSFIDRRGGLVAASNTDFTKYLRRYSSSVSDHVFSVYSPGVLQDTINLSADGNIGISFFRPVSEFDFDPDEYYTMSCWAKANFASAQLGMGLTYFDTSDEYQPHGGQFTFDFESVDTWQYFSKTFKPYADTKYINYAFTVNGYDENEAHNFTIRNCKLEKGTVATTWTPAPEDVYSVLDTRTEYALSIASDVIGTISSITYRYARSATESEPASITSTSIPTLNDSYPYLWQKETISYTDGSPDTVNIRKIWTYGDDNVAVTSIVYSYAVSSNENRPSSFPSSTVPSISGVNTHVWQQEVLTTNAVSTITTVKQIYIDWDETIPSVIRDGYLWSRDKIIYDSGDPTYTVPVCISDYTRNTMQIDIESLKEYTRTQSIGLVEDGKSAVLQQIDEAKYIKSDEFDTIITEKKIASIGVVEDKIKGFASKSYVEEQVDKATGALESYKKTIEKYLTFDAENGLVIQSNDSAVSTVFDETSWEMRVGGAAIQRVNADTGAQFSSLTIKDLTNTSPSAYGGSLILGRLVIEVQSDGTVIGKKG